MNDSSEVKLHFLDYWRVIRVRFGIVILAFLLVMVTTGVTVYFLPRKYYSKVALEVKSDNFKGVQSFDSATGSGPTHGSIEPREMETQFQIIQKKEVLYPVIEKLKLQEKWQVAGQNISMEQAYIRIKRMLEMSEERNTSLMDIGCWSTDAVEAANIANSIAVEYKAKRIDDMEKLVDTGLGQLQEEVANQKKKMDDARTAMAKIAKDQDIHDLNPETMEGSSGTGEEEVKQADSATNEQRMKVGELKSQLEQIKTLTPEQLMDAMSSLGITDPTVVKALPLYQESVAEEARLLSSGFGENHPRVQSIRALKAVYSQQLRDGLDAVKKAQSIALVTAQAKLDSMESKLAGLKESLTQGKTHNAEYDAAKSRYIEEKKLYDAAQMQLETQRFSHQISFVPVVIWERAEPATSPGQPKVYMYMLLGIVVGLTVGVGLAFFIEYLDTSVKTLEDVEKFLNIPVLAVIPKDITLLHRQGGDSPDAEAYRILRTNLEFNRKNPDANTITLVSGGPGEGKSTTLANLAYTCAKGGYNVLIVDADLRRPTQHKIFGIDNAVGLTNYLTSNMNFEEIARPTGVDNLSIIPSGILPTDAVGILNSQRMSDLISRVKRRYDLIFFDSPPILGVSDGSILASEVDLTVMIVQHRRFPRSMLQRVKQAILSVGGNLLGVVLNNVDTKHDQGYQYYTNYYDYYAPPQDGKPKLEPVQARAAGGRAARHGEDY